MGWGGVGVGRRGGGMGDVFMEKYEKYQFFIKKKSGISLHENTPT